MSLPLFFVIVVIFFMGASIGSFVNVVISRLPAGESVVRPRSRCPACRTPITWYDNIPLLSYLILGGRCRYCNEKISPVYPLVEGITGGLSLVVCYWFGLSFVAVGFIVFVAALVAITGIDACHQIIPDVISLPGLAAGLFFSFINPLVTWRESLLGIVAGGGSDANIFNGRGLATAILATGMTHVHSTDETIALADMVTTAELVVSLLIGS